MFIYRQHCVVLATTLSWWWLSSLQLLNIIVPNSIIAVAAVDSSSSSSAETLQLVRSRQRRAQDGMEDEDNTDTTIDVEIVGGDAVPDSSYPYFVWAIGSGNSTAICGGTLIHPDIVLTAANCSALYAPGRLVDVLGDPIFREVDKNYAHPAYVASSHLNDIMLVKLRGTTTTTPVSLNRFKFLSWPRRFADVIGYGVTRTDGTGGNSVPLRRVTLRIGTRAQCKANFGTLYDQRTELCAGARRGDKGTCVGDSGGPLLVGNVQHGIATYTTSPCGKDVASSGFTRVSRYYKWIWYYACDLTAVKTGPCA